MELVDIVEWASDEIFTVTMTQVFANAPWQLKMRKFIPAQGDRLYKKWQDGGVAKIFHVAPYAIANMSEAVHAYRVSIEKNVALSIPTAVGCDDELLWGTYQAAFGHVTNAKVTNLYTLGLRVFMVLN